MATQKELIEQTSKDVTDIKTLLLGSEIDPHDGGLVAEVHQNTQCVKEIKKKQFKFATWFSTIFGLVNASGFIILIRYLKTLLTGGE